MYGQSVTGASRPVVGFDLDKTIPTRLPGVFRSVFLYRSSPIHILDFTSTSSLHPQISITKSINHQTNQQSRVTSTITTVLTAFTSFGLIAVSAWFACERWIYTHHQGQKWLGDVLGDFNARVRRLKVMVHASAAFEWSGKRLKNAGNSLKRVPSQTASFLSVNGGKHDEDDGAGGGGGLPFTQSPEPMSPMKHRTSDAAQSTYGPASAYGVDVKTPPTSPISDLQAEAQQEPVSESTAPRRGRFATAVRSVITLQVSPLAAFSRRPQRQQTASSTVTVVQSDTSGRRMTMDGVPALRSSRVANLMPKLRTLVATQDLAAHQGLVRHLQFSPNGKFLATSR